jgi:hypothetical protein
MAQSEARQFIAALEQAGGSQRNMNNNALVQHEEEDDGRSWMFG